MRRPSRVANSIRPESGFLEDWILERRAYLRLGVPPDLPNSAERHPRNHNRDIPDDADHR